MKEVDVCEVSCVNEQVVNHVVQQVKQSDTAQVSTLFKALADETRMKIAYALTIEEELCVCDVASIVGATTATASHHLRHLRKLGLAKFRKQGKLVYYSLDDDHVKQLISLAVTHQEEVTNRD